jgi:pyruvate dehydrogenase complex dehydrogenase (E1) component
VYAAQCAVEHRGRPTVILGKTVKGQRWAGFLGKNVTHQMKSLT